VQMAGDLHTGRPSDDGPLSPTAAAAAAAAAAGATYAGDGQADSDVDDAATIAENDLDVRGYSIGFRATGFGAGVVAP